MKLGHYWNEKTEDFETPEISEGDRGTHFYIIGASGTGKSKFMEFLITQDIGKNGFAVFDPHGDLVDTVKGYLSAHIAELPDEEGEGFFSKIILIDPLHPTKTAVFNPLERLPGIPEAEQAAELVSAFKKIWADSWGARMEDLLRSSLVVLIENRLTLLELPHLLTDSAFRSRLIEKTRNPIARQYFLTRFDVLMPKTRSEWIESTLNKVGAFLSDDRIRQVLSLQESSFNLREAIDSRKIILINLSKGRLKDNSDLLGSLLLSKLVMAAFSRQDIPQSRRTPYYVYIDEFQNFASDTFVEVLSEARKYGLSLIMAHQNLEQVEHHLKASILANTGVQAAFRVNRKDAETLAKEFFEPTGQEIKSARASGQSFGYQFYSLQEEWEQCFQELQTLPERFCYVKHKREGGLITIRTQEMFPVWEESGFEDEEEYHLVMDAFFTSDSPYLKERTAIEAEAQKRLEDLLEEGEDEIEFRE